MIALSGKKMTDLMSVCVSVLVMAANVSSEEVTKL